MTTVAWPHLEAGRLAAELLIRQMASGDLYYSNIVVRSRLVEGTSCAAPRSCLPQAEPVPRLDKAVAT